MSEMFKSALAYKLVMFYVILFSINSIALAIVTSLNNADWSQMGPTTKFVTVCSIIGQCTTTLMAFFNQSYSRVEQGKSFFPTGQTEFITKDNTMK